MCINDLGSALRLLELDEARKCEGESMTFVELAKRLGVQLPAKGESPIDFINACFQVQDNTNLKTLSRDERLRTMKAAMNTFCELTGRGWD